MITLLRSVINILGDLYDHLMSMRIFTLVFNQICISDPKIMRKVATAPVWIC